MYFSLKLLGLFLVWHRYLQVLLISPLLAPTPSSTLRLFENGRIMHVLLFISGFCVMLHDFRPLGCLLVLVVDNLAFAPVVLYVRGGGALDLIQIALVMADIAVVESHIRMSFDPFLVIPFL